MKLIVYSLNEGKELEQADALMGYRILPDNRALGPRFGKQFPQVRQALADLDPAAVASAVVSLPCGRRQGRVDELCIGRSIKMIQAHAGEPVSITLDGEPVALAADEVVVQTEPAEGLAVAAEKGVTVGIEPPIDFYRNWSTCTLRPQL